MATTKKNWFKQLLDGEPWYYYIGFAIPIICIIILYIAALTGWTMYGKNVAAAPNFWLVVGGIFQAAAIYYVYKKSRSIEGVSGAHIALAGALLALGFIAFAGFRFDVA